MHLIRTKKDKDRKSNYQELMESGKGGIATGGTKIHKNILPLLF